MKKQSEYKFTFRREKKMTGFESESHAIKHQGKEIGSISEQKDHSFQIWFSVEKEDILEDGIPNCTWKNIKLAKKVFKC